MISVSKPRWLFVAYGGGHIRMVLPVMQRVRELGLADPVILALTTANAVARAAGFEPLGFADFVEAGDEPALAKGQNLMKALGAPPVDVRESTAYLGLSYADLEHELGVALAAERYAKNGRQVFHPVRTLERIIRRIEPDLVVATNSPRAERAAIDAAARLGLPSACLVDLFAIDEVAWIGKAGFADRVCVLSEGVRQFLIDMGRAPDDVVVTGNPSFDSLLSETAQAEASGVRAHMLDGKASKVLLFASSAEPASHPFNPGAIGNPELPSQIAEALVRWAHSKPEWVIWIKPHPSQGVLDATAVAPAHLCSSEWRLATVLHAVDAVVVITSTVAVEASLIGKPVLRVLGSLFDRATPFAKMGFVRESVSLADLHAALDRLTGLPTRAGAMSQSLDATTSVVRVLQHMAR